MSHDSTPRPGQINGPRYMELRKTMTRDDAIAALSYDSEPMIIGFVDGHLPVSVVGGSLNLLPDNHIVVDVDPDAGIAESAVKSYHRADGIIVEKTIPVVTRLHPESLDAIRQIVRDEIRAAIQGAIGEHIEEFHHYTE